MNRADYAPFNTPHSGGELFDVIAEGATSRRLAGRGVSAPFLDDHHALEAEHASLVLRHGALEGLEDVAAGRVLDEAELDQALSHATASAPASTSAHTQPRHKKA